MLGDSHTGQHQHNTRTTHETKTLQQIQTQTPTFNTLKAKVLKLLFNTTP